MVLAKHPARLKQLPVQKVCNCAFVDFLLSESIPMPVRYAQQPVIICPLTVPIKLDMSVAGISPY